VVTEESGKKKKDQATRRTLKDVLSTLGGIRTTSFPEKKEGKRLIDGSTIIIFSVV